MSSDIEIVRGGRADDELIGGPGPEELYGRGGDDVLDGGDGAGDLLEGGEGNDLLVDDDRLVDRVFCGGGWDRFQADLLDRVVGCEEAMAIIGGDEVDAPVRTHRGAARRARAARRRPPRSRT